MTCLLSEKAKETYSWFSCPSCSFLSFGDCEERLDGVAGAASIECGLEHLSPCLHLFSVNHLQMPSLFNLCALVAGEGALLPYFACPCPGSNDMQNLYCICQCS